MPLWSLFLLLAALPPNPPFVTAPPPCPTPPQYTYSDWKLTDDERYFQGEWVVQYLHHSRTKTDVCRGTSVGESRVEGPYRLWPAVPANRVADVNRPEGPTDGLSGAPLRSSSLPEGGAPGTVGPNPELPTSRTSGVPANRLPAPLPFFPGFALFAGVLVASFLLRRRTSKQDPVPSHVEEPVHGPRVEPVTAHTMDSIEPNTEWVPDSAEVAWLQAFFGIEEPNYGPLTQEAVKGFQKRHNIEPDPKVMVGPNTYRALWKEHLNLVHEQWQGVAEGRRPLALERVFDSALPPDLREEMAKLNDAYAAYWEAIEGRYQAILRRDPVLVAGYDEQIEAFRASGVKVRDIEPLKAEYQPLIDALYEQAERVKNSPDDGEYTKLLAMLDAADKGSWDEITAAKAAWGGRWEALWSRDASERAVAKRVVDDLATFGTNLNPGVVAGARLGEAPMVIAVEAPDEKQVASHPEGQVDQETDPVYEGEFDPNWPDDKKIAYWRPHAVQAQSDTGIPWQVILAQFGLESRYGRFVPPDSKNAFGVTADGETDPAKYVEADTVEGSGLHRNRKFRKYQSYAESFKDHNKILLSSIYREAMSFNHDPYQYLAMVWVGNVASGYATDPYYLEKVSAIIYTLDTGREATVKYLTDSNTKLGITKVTHVVPTGDYAKVLQERVYGNPTLRAALLKRHQQLYKQASGTSWDYPLQVYLGNDTVSVIP